MIGLRDRLRSGLPIAMMLAPALAIIILIFMVGLLMTLAQSFNYMPLIGKTDLSLDAYLRVLKGPEFGPSLILTSWIAFATTAASTILAIGCALFLRRQFRGKRLLTFIFQLNVPIPHIVGAVGVLLLLSQSGLASRLAYAVGLISQPSDFPILVYDRWGLGIIAEYVWKTTCFTGLIALAVLQSIGDDYEDVARSLGANPWQRFRYVILPLILPGVLRASVLVFAMSFGWFAIPYLLGQRFPSALPVVAYRNYTDVDLNARPEAMAISVMISALGTVLAYAYMKITRKVVRQD